MDELVHHSKLKFFNWAAANNYLKHRLINAPKDVVYAPVRQRGAANPHSLEAGFLLEMILAIYRTSK